MSTFMVDDSLSTPNMRTTTLATAVVSALLIVGLGAGGAFAATNPLQPQESTTDTGNTTTAASDTPTAEATSAGTATGSSGPSITFNDQESSGETVLIESATIPTNGFIVVNGTGGGAEQIIGSSYLLNAGTADNVRIELDRPLNDTESLTAVLYADSNGNGAFDADADEPVYQGDSDRRIVDIAEVTVQDSSATATSAESDAAGGSTSAATQADAGDAETTAASGADEGAGTSGANGSSGNESGGSGGSGPGFGPVVAVVALLAVAFLVRRR